MSRSQKILLIFIFVLLSFFIFFRLDRADMFSDDGHYAFRALGYFDYLGSYDQTTPIQWFGERPLWSYLSFHDHPPLFFLIQHFFFRILGASLLVSRLTSAFAALGSAVVLFLIARRRGSAKAALLTASALIFNNYFIWTGRVGLLESLLIFFSLIGIYFLRRGESNSRFILPAGFFFGLAFMSKLSFIFIGFGILAFYLFEYYQRRGSPPIKPERRRLLQGIVIFLMTISPYLVYNLAIYRERGHFDVQLSDILLRGDSANRDWPILGKRVGAANVVGNISGFVTTLADGYSLPYLLLLAAAILFVILKYRGGRRDLDLLPVFVLGSMLLFFSFVGVETSWLGITAPFAALIVGQFLSEISGSALSESFVIALAIYLAFFIINSNNLTSPIGRNILSVSPLRIENKGYRQLDERISALYNGRRSATTTREVVNIVWYHDFKPEEIDFTSELDSSQAPVEDALLVYDIKMNWFDRIWIFDRWKFYKKFLIINSEEFVNSARRAESLAAMKRHVDKIYFVEASPEIEVESGVISRWTPYVTRVFQSKQIKPEVIADDAGRPAFYIYSGPISEIFTEPIVIK